MANALGHHVSCLLGDAKGGLGPAQAFEGGDASFVVVADFDRDHRPDVAATHWWGGVRVLRNTTRPVISALKPSRGGPGTTVTILGSPDGYSFGRRRGTSRVFFGGAAVTRYVSWSANLIKVRVPATTAGKKAVTVRTSIGKSNVKYFTVL